MLSINKKTLFIFLIFIAVLLISSHSYAVKIIPPRLVLGPDVKVEYMFIKNNSDHKESYRFSWKHIAMDKEGNVLNLDKIGIENAPPGYQPLDKIIRFSPRRAVLEPGQTQRVTFIISRAKNLPAGEYRSHFLVAREPKKKQENIAATDENDGKDPAASPKVSVDVLISRAVPIYVLNGETSASLELLGAEIKKNVKKKKPFQPDHLAHFKVQKTGNRSIIGIATVFCQSGGKDIVISKSSKVFAVYAEGEYRNETMAVQLPAEGCSSYRMVIKGHHDDLLAGEILANKTFK